MSTLHKTITVAACVFACGSLFAQQPTSVKWMLEYAQKADEPWKQKDVRNDPRFKVLMQQALNGRASAWGKRRPLTMMAETALGVGTGVVTVKDQQFYAMSGCVPHMCTDVEGFLWIDSRQRTANVYFATFENVSPPRENPMFNIWIFPPKNLSKPAYRTSREDDHRGLPPPFIDMLGDWFNEIGDKQLVSVTIVNPDGVLVALPPCELHISQHCKE